MKYLYLLSISLLFVACGADENENQDIGDIERYLEENNITAEYVEPGYYIKIDNPGSEDKPNISSKVTCDYKGYLLSNDVFDENEGIEFPLSGVIRGWQLGMQRFGKGGSGTLFLPPNLGYGERGTNGIPSNAALIFDVKVIDFE